MSKNLLFILLKFNINVIRIVFDFTHFIEEFMDMFYNVYTFTFLIFMVVLSELFWFYLRRKMDARPKRSKVEEIILRATSCNC